MTLEKNPEQPGGMENLLSMPPLSEMETEEGKIISEMVQLLNYICVAPTLNRQELATKLMGVAAKCMDTLNSQKMKIQALEKLHVKVNKRPERSDEDSWSDEYEESEECDDDEFKESCAHRLLMDLKCSATGQTMVTSTSEYTVEDILGQGNFGVVAQCLKKPANETVAVKMIRDRHLIEEAEEEVEILNLLKGLDCERFNVACCRDAFMFKGHFCMEFRKLDVSLFNYIGAQGSLELKDLRPVHQQMTVGLRFLKDAGVVHGDLKPENIMLVDRVQQPLKVQIIDFGLAMRNTEKSVGKLFGTLEYISPEVLLGVPSNSPIDVWSSGCIAGEMLTGRPVFNVCDEWELMHRIVAVVGQPPDKVLERGVNTRIYFKRRLSQPTRDWVLKPHFLGICDDVQHKNLHDLLKAPVAVPTEEEEAVECDRLAFVDLMEKTLNTNTEERISPLDVLSHPFLTLSHLSDQRYSSYVKSSMERMKVCEDWSFGGEENAPRSVSGSSTNGKLPITEPPPNGEEEPPGQDLRGEESSPEEPPECASSLPEQNEATRPDSSSTENSQSKRRTRSPGLLKRAKTALMKRIRKLMS